MMFVSLVNRVGCDVVSTDTRLPRLFYNISIPQEHESSGKYYTSADPVVPHSDMDDGWTVVYSSEVLTDSTLAEWQPLDMKHVFPLGLPPRVRAQTSLKLVLCCAAQRSVPTDEEEIQQGRLHGNYPMFFLDTTVVPDRRLPHMRVDSAEPRVVGTWIVQFREDGPHVETLCDVYSGKIRLFIEMRDESRVYLVSPGVYDPGKTLELTEKVAECLSLDDVQKRVMSIHTLQRAWQHERQVSLQRKALCEERLSLCHHDDDDHDDDEEEEEEQKEEEGDLSEMQRWHARYCMLQERIIYTTNCLLHVEETRRLSVDDVRLKQKVKLQALLNTLQALVLASGKVHSSTVALEGHDGQGRIDAMGQQMEAKRAMMLAQIRTIYRVCRKGLGQDGRGDKESHVESHMDARWSGMQSHSLQTWNRDATTATTSPTTGDDDDDDDDDETGEYYSICDSRIHAFTWKYAFEKDGHHYDDPDADRETRVALGYVAHMLVKISEYIDIPLRYPIMYRGSYSVIRDNYSKNSGSSTTDGMSPEPREFPLYCESPKERPKYAIAVFLLNKDIIQVLTYLYFLRDHTEPPRTIQNSPNKIAQNLYSLLTFYDSQKSKGHKSC